MKGQEKNNKEKKSNGEGVVLIASEGAKKQEIKRKDKEKYKRKGVVRIGREGARKAENRIDKEKIQWRRSGRNSV